MGRQSGRVGRVLAGIVLALLALGGPGLAAEEPAPTPRGFVAWLGDPVPTTLPFRLTGEVELGAQKLEGQRDSPNFRTYRVIEEGFVANRFRLGLETKDQRRFIEFQGLDIGKNDQNYSVSIGQYGRYRLDFEWDQIPHLYGKGKTPFERSEGGIYNLPGTPLPALPDFAATFNGSTLSDFKIRKDSGRAGFWWAPTPEWDLQLNYEHVRHAGNRPMGAGFDNDTGNIVELPEPIEWQIDQLNAVVGYSTKVWQLQGGYRLSIFGNDIKTMTFDNPCFMSAEPACAATENNSSLVPQGRTVLAPDNQAHNLFLTGGLNLPMATRLTAKVAYGINRQNDTFFAQTINGALLGASPGLQLLAPSLRGDVRTLLINATATTRPIRDVTVTAKYRFYDKDNRTLVQTFQDLAVRDTFTEGMTRLSRIFDYQKQNGDLDVAWRALRQVTLRGGFGWERWDRPDTREVGRTDEYSGKFGLTYRPLSWLEIVGRYTRSWKRIDEYNTFAPLAHLVLPENFSDETAGFQSPLLRKFDEAARDRHKAEMTVRLRPMQGLDAGISLAFGRDHYPFSPLGLQEDRNWSAGVDVGYTPVSWLTLRANYQREEYHSRQRSRFRPDDVVPLDMSDLDWISRNVDTFDTVGAGALVRLIPDRLDLQAQYTHQRSIARVVSFNVGTPGSVTAGVAADDPDTQARSFPDDRFSLHRLSASLRYWLLKNLALRLGYAYERFRTSYWRTDFLQPAGNVPIGTEGTADVFLGVKPFQNYEVHIIGGGITYGF